jgi:hypothetical protein
MSFERSEVRPYRPPYLLAAAAEIFLERVPGHWEDGRRTGIRGDIPAFTRDPEQALTLFVNERPRHGLGFLFLGRLLQPLEDPVQQRIIYRSEITQ